MSEKLDLSDSLVLVSCTATKLPDPAPAKDLYTSSKFKKTRALVEGHGAPWFILSALHGLLPPDKVIEPYELALNTMGISDRRAWADKVWLDLEPLLQNKRRVTFFAGKFYREFLIKRLCEKGIEVDVKSLRQGNQSKWLKDKLAEMNCSGNPMVQQTPVRTKPQSAEINRLDDLKKLYDLLARLEKGLGGVRLLKNFSQYQDWPERGVYFFFAPDEHRSDSGNGFRLVRVGTHALKYGAQSTLRQRLRQHRGNSNGGGNHRGSIFRLLIGQTMIEAGETPACPSWGMKSDMGKAAKALNTDRDALKNSEQPVEEAVSRYIGAMPFLWLDVGDEPSPQSQRGYIERNSIALLSNHGRPPLDSLSDNWLGRRSDRVLVRGSELWNQRHVGEAHDPDFIGALERFVQKA